MTKGGGGVKNHKKIEWWRLLWTAPINNLLHTGKNGNFPGKIINSRFSVFPEIQKVDLDGQPYLECNCLLSKIDYMNSHMYENISK